MAGEHRMNLARYAINGNGFSVPCVLLTPENPLGAAVIVHGYGGCKEEQLGLAWRVAEMGFATCAIDLRGHGEHSLPLDMAILDDIEAAIGYMHQFGKVVAVGHSMGGRLALLSSADRVVAISPAVCPTYSASIHRIIQSWSYRVREPFPAFAFEILEKLPVWRPDGRDRVRIIYGSRDMPEIFAGCKKLGEHGVPITEIPGAFHSDIYTEEATFDAVRIALGVQR